MYIGLRTTAQHTLLSYFSWKISLIYASFLFGAPVLSSELLNKTANRRQAQACMKHETFIYAGSFLGTFIISLISSSSYFILMHK